MSHIQPTLDLEPQAPPHVPGHRYQLVGICQCDVLRNDGALGVSNSIERFGVVSRLRITPEQHAEHVAALLGGAS
jgi:hypothetical protein